MPTKPKTTRQLFLEELAALEDEVGSLTDELASELEELVLKHSYGDPNGDNTAFKSEHAMRKKINRLMAAFIAGLSTAVLDTNENVARIRAEAEYKEVTDTLKGYRRLTASQKAQITRSLRNDVKNTPAEIRKILETRKPFLDRQNLEYRYRTVQKGATRTVNTIIDLGLRRNVVRGYDKQNRPIYGAKSAVKIAKEIREYIKPELVPTIDPRELHRQRFGFEQGSDVNMRGGSVEYNSMRIARTETQRTYREIPARLAKKKKYAKGIQWVLSRAHPVEDICDELATADKYKLGKGVYPMDKLPNSHPNCLCGTQTVIQDESTFLKMLKQGKI